MLGSNLSAEASDRSIKGAVRNVRSQVYRDFILWSRKRKIPGVWGLAPIKIRQNSFRKFTCTPHMACDSREIGVAFCYYRIKSIPSGIDKHPLRCCIL